MSPIWPLHTKPFASSQSSGPFEQPDPNCPKSRGKESVSQVRTALPDESVAAPAHEPIDLQRPCALQEMQSSWTSHVKVQLRSMHRTPALSAQSEFDVHGLPTSAPTTAGELGPSQNDPRVPLSEVRAAQSC